MELESKNLVIRNHRESDGEDLFAYLSLPEIYKYEPGEPITREEAQAYISERSRGDDFLGVVKKSENRMIGHLYFHRTEPEQFLTWELGFIFNPEFQNRGYCTEASLAIIEYAFTEMNAHKIVAFCNPHNIASWKVLEKTGMTREGFFREKAFFRRDSLGNPLWHDCFAYGILNEQN